MYLYLCIIGIHGCIGNTTYTVFTYCRLKIKGINQYIDLKMIHYQNAYVRSKI